MSIIQKVMPGILVWAVLLSVLGLMYGGFAMAVTGMYVPPTPYEG